MRAYTSIRAVLRDCEKALLDFRRDAVLSALGITNRVKVADAIGRYIEHLKATCTAGHAKVRRSILGKWTASIGDVHHMDALKPSHVQEHIDALTNSGAARWTVRNAYAAIHAFLEWAGSMEMIPTNAAAKVTKPRVPKGNPKALPPEWISTIMSEVEGLGRLVVAVALAVLAGIRRAEACRLEWADVDFSGRMLTMRAAAAKTGLERHVPINPRLLSILREAYRERGTVRFLVRGKRADGSADPDKLGKAVVEFFRARHGGTIGMQLLRATWETALLDMGVPPQQVATWAGHSVAVQQMHYAHRDGTRHREVLDRLAM